MYNRKEREAEQRRREAEQRRKEVLMPCKKCGMEKELKCECGEKIYIEAREEEEIELICPLCKQTLRGIASAEYIQLTETF